MENNATKQNQNTLTDPLDLREEQLNRTFWSLAGPAVLENLLMSMVFFADSLIIGWLRSEESLAAAALAGVLMYLLQAPFFALASATVSLVSRYWGERSINRACRYAGRTLGLAFLFSALMCLVGGMFAGPLLNLLGAKSSVIALGRPYLRVIFLSALPGIPLIITNAAIRAVGNTRTPMLISLAVNVLNVMLSILLAFGCGPVPALGLCGVAWGTVFSRTLGCLCSLAVMRSSRLGLGFRLAHLLGRGRHLWRDVWDLAAPAIAERLLHTGAHVLFMRIVAVLGTTALAAHNIALHAESLAFMPAVGFSMATATIVGQAIGARRPRIAELATIRSVRWVGLLMLVLSAAFVLLAPRAVAVFRATSDVRALAGAALQVGALELPFLGAGIVISGALRAAGDTRSPLIITVACVVLFRLALVYLFGIRLAWGLPGIWLATAVDWLGRAVGLWFFFRAGRWRMLHKSSDSAGMAPAGSA